MKNLSSKLASLIDTQKIRPFNLIDITTAMVEDDSESLLEASDIDEYGEVKELFEELSKVAFPLSPNGVKENEVCVSLSLSLSLPPLPLLVSH